jgi:N-acetylglucosaminyl-diphospho-decaprenol L-rhamnosyltransferase
MRTTGKMMDVSILIISYNTRELTLACLASVYAQTRDVEFEILVVDNESKDGSADAIASAYPHVRLIRPGANLGFAGGNNLAAKSAAGEFLLLLNPDTVILDGAIQKAVAFARSNPRAGIVGGRTYFGDMTLNPTSVHGRPTAWSLLCMGMGLSTLFRQTRLFDPESLGRWPRDSHREVDVVTGCFCLVRRDLWQTLGGYDESFFMYGEDTDLSIRAWEVGSACMVCPDAKLIHYGGQSEKVRSDKMIRLFRAKAQLFEKHWSRPAVWFGILMLKFWALTRTLGTGLWRYLNPAKQASYEAWRDIWRRRAEFADLRSKS